MSYHYGCMSFEIHKEDGSSPKDKSESSFRDAAASLMRAETEGEALSALSELRCSGAAAAAWECVNEALFGRGQVALIRGGELREALVAALQRGTPSQLADLAERLDRARLPLSFREMVAAEAFGAAEDTRRRWFRDLVSGDPYRRLRSVDFLCAVSPGLLSNQESMTVAKYLFSGCADDHGALLLRDGPDALASFPFTAERIGHFFSRHSSPGALAIAETVMGRNQMISFVACSVLVEHGQQAHRDAAFSHIVSGSRLLLGGFEGWSEYGLASVEPKLLSLLQDETKSESVVAGVVRALGRLSATAERDEALLRVVKSRAWQDEVVDAVAATILREGPSAAAVAFAQQELDPPKPGFSWYKGLFSHFGYTRPAPAVVELSVKVLEAQEFPGRQDLFRRALSAWDISSPWIQGPSRAFLASLLPAKDLAAEHEMVSLPLADLVVASTKHFEQLLRFASESSLDTAKTIVEGVVIACFDNAGAMARASRVLRKLYRTARRESESASAEVVEFVTDIARRFPSSAVKTELIVPFYENLDEIPSGARRAFRQRLMQCLAEWNSTKMVVLEAELEAMKRLADQDRR